MNVSKYLLNLRGTENLNFHIYGVIPKFNGIPSKLFFSTPICCIWKKRRYMLIVQIFDLGVSPILRPLLDSNSWLNGNIYADIIVDLFRFCLLWVFPLETKFLTLFRIKSPLFFVLKFLPLTKTLCHLSFYSFDIPFRILRFTFYSASITNLISRIHWSALFVRTTAKEVFEIMNTSASWWILDVLF